MSMATATHNSNPAVSPVQYRLAQAVLSGTARETGMPVSVAREIVDRTPAKLRSEYSKWNPEDKKRFTDRIRFNWGYWDGVQAAKEGWPYRYEHFDKVWLKGFQAGYNDQRNGEVGDTSDRAWKEYQQSKKKNPSGKEYIDFLENKIRVLESVQPFTNSQADRMAAENLKAYREELQHYLRTGEKKLNPYYGMDLDVETEMTPAWIYYGSEQAWKTAKRLYEAEGKKVVVEKKRFGSWPQGKYRLRMKSLHERGKNPSASFGGNLHQQLVSAATQYDMKEEAKAAKRKHGYHNIYALSQYLGRIEEVEKEIAAGTPVRKALTDAFSGRLLDAMLKAVGEKKSVREEQMGGYVYSPSRSNPSEESAEMYESFHGEPSDETVEYVEEEHYHSNLAALGEMVELKVKLTVGEMAGSKVVIGFEPGKEEERENPVMYEVVEVRYDPEAKPKVIDRLPYHKAMAKLERMKKRYPDRSYRIGESKWEEEKKNPFWPFNSFTKTTIYHVGTGDKYSKKGSYKGYVLYQKNDTKEFLVPALDKESRFDTNKDAKQFIDAWTKHHKNPGGPLDSDAARELELFVENDADLYRQQYTPINKNLITKMARGVYNHAGAVKLFGYLMESGAKKYAKQYGSGEGDWHQIFSPATRKHVAERFADHFETEAKLGNYDSLLPKKYQKKNPTKLDKMLDQVAYGKREITFDVRDWTREQVDRLTKTAESRGFHVSSDGKFVLVRKMNPGRHHGPFHAAGKFASRATRAAEKPFTQFTGTVGKVGGYLDDRLGQILKNPDEHKTGPTLLCSNEDGTQLYLIGGDQTVDLSGLGIKGPEADKEMVYIGHVTHLTYHTHKKFDGKVEEYDYVHRMGEDGGEEPLLNYDRLNRQLILSGGTYKINKPLFGTSPGIEN